MHGAFPSVVDWESTSVEDWAFQALRRCFNHTESSTLGFDAKLYILAGTYAVLFIQQTNLVKHLAVDHDAEEHCKHVRCVGRPLYDWTRYIAIRGQHFKPQVFRLIQKNCIVI